LLLPRVVRDPLRALLREPLMPGWLNGRWFAEHGVRPAARPTPEGRDALREQLMCELTEVKLPRLLRYGDRNSMAFSLEARFPFLSPALTGFLLSLPEEYVLASDGTSKAVLRCAMEGIVPTAVLERRDKIGFQPPFQTWMRALGPGIEQLLGEAEPSSLPPVPLERLRADWRAWANGEGHKGLQRLWRCLNVVRWADLLHVSFDDG
jgi:asparagine synthase (glutamine-hydrolysing)